MENIIKKFEEELDRYRKEKNFNILVPTQTIKEISPFHKPVLEIVKVNPDPSAGEVYELVQGSGEYSLRATALQKIGYAAGLIWNARGCHRTDDGSDPDVVSYRAEAAVRKEDGTYMLLNAEYMVDLRVIEEETRESYEKKSQILQKEKKWTEQQRKDYVEKCVKRDMLQKRKFRLQLAQTGAMDRVIRKILGLKGTYKKEELEKPFVVPKIAFNPDISDPKVRELLLKQGLDATNLLYGSSERSLIDFHCRAERMIDVTPQIELKKEEVSSESILSDRELPIEKEEEPQEGDFEKLGKSGQIVVLKALIKKKKYNESNLKKPLEEFTDSERKRFYDHLMAMPEPEELPF